MARGLETIWLHCVVDKVNIPGISLLCFCVTYDVMIRRRVSQAKITCD